MTLGPPSAVETALTASTSSCLARARARRSATAGESMLSTTEVCWGASAGAGSASGDGVSADAASSVLFAGSTAVSSGVSVAGGSAGAGFDSAAPSSPSSMRPRSKAWKPGGAQVKAAARPSAVTPTGTSPPSAKALSIAAARVAFLSLRWADAHSTPSVSRAMASIRSLRRRDQNSSAVGRTWAAKSMPSRATVASSSGRAPCSKASWPFTVRAAQAANRLCLPASGKALSAAKASPSSSMASQSNGSDERSASMASPGLIAAKASSLALSGGRSGVSRTAMSRAWSW